MGVEESDSRTPGETRSISETQSPAAVTTRVLWESVTGSQLEELLYGLLEAMGARNLVWRAGAAHGVTAADNGRDLEATFDRPAPDGELDRQLWWIESKGRSGTVERDAVQKAVFNASARSDLDVIVVATNSRFSNPTRDWVSESMRSRPRPAVRLWDRETLDRLVRKYPVVAARVFPGSLSDSERLELLLTRYNELGEEPTSADLEYFWNRREWLKSDPNFVPAVGMFLYCEGVPFPVRRPWSSLIEGADAVFAAIVESEFNNPARLFQDNIARPFSEQRMLASSARLLAAALSNLGSPVIAAEVMANPWPYVDDDGINDEAELRQWQDGAVRPALAWLQAELLDPCASDCHRVVGENVHEPQSLSNKDFWRAQFGEMVDVDKEALALELPNMDCTVKLDMSKYGCPLVISNETPLPELIARLHSVLTFRRSNPNTKPPSVPDPDYSGVRITAIGNGGLSWRTRGA